jgi:hypothetical protein
MSHVSTGGGASLEFSRAKSFRESKRSTTRWQRDSSDLCGQLENE